MISASATSSSGRGSALSPTFCPVAAAVVFDLLFRVLRHIYGPDHVTYVRNITDVDDKINARAAERGIAIGELTQTTVASHLFQWA